MAPEELERAVTKQAGIEAIRGSPPCITVIPRFGSIHIFHRDFDIAAACHGLDNGSEIAPVIEKRSLFARTFFTADGQAREIDCESRAD